MNDDDGIVMSCLGIIVWAIFISLITVLVRSWALSVLWGWIMVPTFELPYLLYWQAFGIMAIVGFITSNLQNNNTNSGSKKKTWVEIVAESLVNATIVPVSSVGIVWLVLKLYGVF